MKKNSTPSFVLTLKLNTSPMDIYILERRFRIAATMYNKLVAHAQKRIKGLRNDGRYRRALSQYKNNKYGVSDTLESLRKEYGLSEYQFHSWIQEQQHRYSKNIDSLTAQKIATEVWTSVSAVLFKDGKQVHFQKQEERLSVEGKNNASGIRFSKGTLQWNGLSIHPQVRRNDSYAREALTHRVKYCRIIRKAMGITWHYYLQLVLEGLPPKKHKFLSEGRVGIDPGVSTEAIVSDKGCVLTELAPERPAIEKEVTRLQRRMDRSRRATNPGNYNPNGTAKPKKQCGWWVCSKRYRKDRMRLKTLRRRNADTVRQSEEVLANVVLTEHGSDVITEKMSYDGLQHKTKTATINENTGRYRSRKRFGASIARHAPARFLSILERKLGYIDKILYYVDTVKFRASQYDHRKDKYIPVSLSDRWKKIGNRTVQRDLYSAFLLMNAQDTEKPDRDRCKRTFRRFLKHHQICVDSIRGSGTKVPSSFGF